MGETGAPPSSGTRIIGRMVRHSLVWLVVDPQAGPRDGASPDDSQPADGDGDGDRDGDGVADATDDCPDKPDPLQRDHDGDGIGDVCDRCPHVSSAPDLDGDDDGVGDACDPNPTQPGETFVAFIGFYDEDATAVADWTETGTWTVTGGHLVQTPQPGQAFISTDFVAERGFVQTSMRLDNMEDSSAVMGIVFGLIGTPPSPAQFYQCVISRQQGGLIGAKRTGQAQDTILDWNGDLDSGTVISMTSDVLSDLTCAFTDNASTTESVSTSAGAGTAGNVLLISQDAGVSYDFLFVATGS